ncbi:relaxase/mobilization nuclease domain-containing protein [Allorhizobium taibaishanense]|uniref:Type IV secretory pathway VirD2 relaxase n=1 Tax=Allorhizobium taibaishanense TaxID=887144 RepID=A0A1Q9A090_9HYPH|nr:VirD2 family relaxase/mobilization nuclease [Allorhizobium taibaishanense]MBB4010454.1 type IV secretory pathway VirD2 relaxase [Allorhizobium taibaishanense]OLP47998.1 type VI secretion protein [Allorhizobium taibaishanense]
MASDDDFRVRTGRIRSSRSQRARPFIAQALAAVEQAGGRVSRSGKISNGKGRSPSFARGRVASIRANRLITGRTRLCTVKARVVRNNGQRAPLTRHLDYLRREGVTRDGEKARLFGPEDDTVDVEAFAGRLEADRHHFRFIVSPEDAVDLEDLKRFTRELMRRAEKDLGTKLDWAGVDHWNTDNPHVHVIVRGRTDNGQDLVIDRDYIRSGLRDRAQDLLTQELGPRTEHDVCRSLERQIEADRWTRLDRQLAADAGPNGIIDVAPSPDRQPDSYLVQKVGRLRYLERLGLAQSVGGGQWILRDEAEETLRELGIRGDVIKRMHRALTDQGIERATADYVLGGERHGSQIIGRLLARGHDDELNGTAFAVVDGIDGRAHHIRFPDLEATGDGAPGSIVELRDFEDAKGEGRASLAVRSDFALDAQIKADGATWLDRQLIGSAARDPGYGFGLEVRQAMETRTEHLIDKGLARREAGQVIFAPNLLGTLSERELNAVGEKLSQDMNMPFQKAGQGDYVAGTYRQRFVLASGRFAMVDDGLGFKLVPWTPSMEKHLGQHISGVARSDGGVDWSFGRKRGLGL